MATIITMPAVVADATEATVQEWLVAVGDTIAVGQPIAEIETEKATIELAAETAGEIGKLLVEAGTSVVIGGPLAVLIGPGENNSTVEQQIAVAGSDANSEAEHPVPSSSEAPTKDPATHPSEQDPATSLPGQAPAARIFSSPLARKLAKDLGVPVSTLNGSGPHGRILRRDVELAAHQNADNPGEAFVPDHSLERNQTTPAPVLETLYNHGAFEDIPLSGMRRVIARRLTESKTTVPHFYVSIDVHMDALLALRGQINEAAQKNGAKVTVNDLILKALGGAIAETPDVNATWGGDSIRRYSAVDVSVAIATNKGLLTPVVRGLENLSLGALSRIMADYKERAANGRIRQQELEGGSFSLTNLGMYGTRDLAAILNPPQSGILGVGAAEKRPVVRDNSLAIATVMSCTLSADHRVIDGAAAAQLMATFKRRIENPLSILL